MPNILTLIRAIKVGDIERVTYCVDAGVNINRYGRGGESILQIACLSGSVEIVHLLLQHGADVNMKVIESSDDPDFYDTALHTIADSRPPIRNQLEIASLLLHFGADLNASPRGYRNYKTPLDIATERKNTKLGKFLKASGGQTSYAVRTRQFFNAKRKVLHEIQAIKKARRSKLKTWPCMARLLEELRAYANYHPCGWRPIYEGISDIQNTSSVGAGLKLTTCAG